jgi:hypothetical protein
MIYETIELIKVFISGSPLALSLSALVERRNILQHTLICLPSAGSLNEANSNLGFVPSAAYDGIRLAVMVFSIAVMFPMPMSSGALYKATANLKRELELNPFWWGPDMGFDLSNESPAASPGGVRGLQECLLWILVLGGIAAQDTPERLWFAKCLGMLVAAMGISEWTEVQLIMSGFLWLDSACDGGGWLLWREVEHVGVVNVTNDDNEYWVGLSNI